MQDGPFFKFNILAMNLWGKVINIFQMQTHLPYDLKSLCSNATVRSTEIRMLHLQMAASACVFMLKCL